MIQLLGKLPLIAHAHIHSLAHSRKHQRLKLGKKMKKNIDALETLSSLSFHSLARSLTQRFRINFVLRLLLLLQFTLLFFPFHFVLLYDLFWCERHDTHVISLGVFSSAFWTCNLLCMFLSLIRRQFNPFAERDDFYDKVKKSQECCCSQFIHLFFAFSFSLSHFYLYFRYVKKTILRW